MVNDNSLERETSNLSYSFGYNSTFKGLSKALGIGLEGVDQNPRSLFPASLFVFQAPILT